jgi:hypothetical protein
MGSQCYSVPVLKTTARLSVRIGKIDMDKEEASRLLEDFMQELQCSPYHELKKLIRNPVCIELAGEGNEKYQIEYEAFWDSSPGEDLRVLASIDDGRILSAMFPISRDFIITKEGDLR